jgi:hypothetical protein
MAHIEARRGGNLFLVAGFRKLTCMALALAVAASASASDRGSAFFYERVVPKLVENGCPNCHAVGYIRPQVLKYEDALKYLAMGDSAETSVIVYKLANLRSISPDRPTHPGGQRCKTPDSEPCRTIMEWWRVEFGQKRPRDSGKK